MTVNNTEVPFQHPWQRFSYRFGRNIHVFGESDILVANNRVNDKHYAVDHRLPGWESIPVDDFLMEGYRVQDTKRIFGSNSSAIVELQPVHEPVFSYTNHYGIYVRGSALSDIWGAAPWQGPALFHAGTTVRDNWVYTTMRVGYHLSGYGLKVLGNVKKDRAGKNIWIHPTGMTTAQASQTFENRGIDVGGSRILIEGNRVEVERHRVNGSGYFSTDGEGILVQECCGGTTVDGLVIRQNEVNAYIGIYKMPYVRDLQITGNTLGTNLTGSAYIYVNANKNGTQAPLFGITVADNVFQSNGSILVSGLSGGGDIQIMGNVLNGGSIEYPEGISVLSGNSGYSQLKPIMVGAVRDYPLVSLATANGQNTVAAGEPVVLRVRVPGRLLQPNPVQSADLPEIARVELYAGANLIASWTTAVTDPDGVAWLYETTWTPSAGLHQISAQVTPSAYAGPSDSTAWFTVSPVLHLLARSPNAAANFAGWAESNLVGEPELRGLLDDPDQDGVANLLEYALGNDPLTPEPRSEEWVWADADVAFQFRSRIGLEDYQLLAEWSNDLLTWQTSGLLLRVMGETDGVRSIQARLPWQETPRYLRLAVRRQ